MMAGTVSRKGLNIPEGLHPIMECITRAVIAKKPPDILLFVLYYFVRLKEFRKAGHPNFDIKRLVREFHRAAEATIPVNGLEKELKRMGYLKPEHVSDQTAVLEEIPSDAAMTTNHLEAPPEKESQEKKDTSEKSLATTQPMKQQHLMSSKHSSTRGGLQTNNMQAKPSTCVKEGDQISTQGERPTTGNSATIPKTKDKILSETPPSSCTNMTNPPSSVKKGGASSTVGEPRANRESVTTAKARDIVPIQAPNSLCTDVSSPPITENNADAAKSAGDHPAAGHSGAIPNTNEDISSEDPTSSVTHLPFKIIVLNESAIPPHSSPEAEIAKLRPSDVASLTPFPIGEILQNNQLLNPKERELLKSLQVFWYNPVEANKEDSTQTKSTQTEWPALPSNATAELQSPSRSNSDVCTQSTRPLAPCPSWNPGFYGYPYHPNYQRHSSGSHGSNGCDGDATQGADQNSEREQHSYPPRCFWTPMPFHPPYPMQGACWHYPRAGQTSPCRMGRPYETMQINTAHGTSKSAQMSPSRQGHPANAPPSTPPGQGQATACGGTGLHPPAAPLGWHPYAPYSYPLYTYTVMPAGDMTNAGQAAFRQQRPCSAPVNKGDSHPSCHDNPQSCSEGSVKKNKMKMK
ncbi:uncharacterized protein LOC134450870 [Engraulis encrasicolus]|uniref:uncharacterized protein LOC134450870 n=1 Tax=Engraulis encrasicolus TaxID=184585 RepID=UPI002FD78434